MTPLGQIQQAAVDCGLEFLLIGGFAVIEHGFPRLTTDIDLLILKERRDRWSNLLQRLGYTELQREENFEQYSRGEGTPWPVDLMLVNQASFDGMKVASLSVCVQGVNLRMVCLDHLLALKLHALKQGKLHRFLRDFEDVVQLARINKLDLESSRWRELLLRYGTADLYEKIRRAAAAE